MVIMTVTGGLMYAFAPVLIGVLTPVPAIRELGAEVLRIEAFAEPFFAAQIVGAGVFRGAQDTLGPSVINFSTMWIIRLPLAYFLSSRIGLRGVWIAMCLQLIICGIFFLIRLWWKSRKSRMESKPEII
jgi:Na+-driven multidrug efflux pump